MNEQDRRKTNKDVSVPGDRNVDNTNNNGDGYRCDEDNCSMIVNALLTFAMTIIRKSTDLTQM